MSVYLSTDRNDVYQYSSNIGVPYLFFPAWVEFSSGWYRSFRNVARNIYIYTIYIGGGVAVP